MQSKRILFACVDGFGKRFDLFDKLRTGRFIKHRSNLNHPHRLIILSSIFALITLTIAFTTSTASVDAAPPNPATGPVYWVNDPGDIADVAPGDGVCWNGMAALPATGRLPCTLRAAITEANLDGVPSTIAFEICPADIGPNADGSYTIFPGSAGAGDNLPALTDPSAGGYTYINGYTQGFPQATPGYDDPVVTALGAAVCGAGARIATPNTASYGLPMNGVLAIIVDGLAGAPVPAPMSAITPVRGGYVPSGSIVMWGGALSGASTGFTVLDNRNVIAGLNIRNFENAGILIMPDVSMGFVPPYGNVVWGNYIGTDVDGVGPMGNRFGVEIIGGSVGNYVGDTSIIRSWGLGMMGWTEERTSAERNLISGNDNHPVPDLYHSYGSKCSTAPGMPGTRFHDDGAGVFMGVDPCIRMSDNPADDVLLGGAVDNHVRNNYIGSDFSGTGSIPNSNGVWLNYDAGAAPSMRPPSGAALYPGNHIGGCVKHPFTIGVHPDCSLQSDFEQDPNLISGSVRRINMPMRADHDGGHGVWINGAPDPYFAPSGPSASFNEIGGNFIGTIVSGTKELPNSGNGVFMLGINPASPIFHNEIGATNEMVPGFSSSFFTMTVFSPLGSNYGYGNLISANGDPLDVHPLYGEFDHGVEMMGPGVVVNRVGYGNIIGLNHDGTETLGNANSGVRFAFEASDNYVHNNSGTPTSKPFVVDDPISEFGAISGNGTFTSTVTPHDSAGVLIEFVAKNNAVFSNCIGGDADDCSEDDLGNTASGVYIGHDANKNLIGQSVSGGGDRYNDIHHNGWDGVSVVGADSDGNAIRFNSIWQNGNPGGVPLDMHLGIDLNDDDDTPNDVDDLDMGPNEELNYPSGLLLTPTVSYTVAYTSCTGCTIDIYASLGAESDSPLNNGEGRYWIKAVTGATTTLTTTIETELVAIFGTPLPMDICVVMTATDSADNTSEFSPCATIAPPAPPTAVTTQSQHSQRPTTILWLVTAITILTTAAHTYRRRRYR